MVAVPKANINAETLRWVRVTTGLTVEAVAGKSDVRAEALQEWESGDSLPSIPQLRKLAKTYRRPIAFFFRSQIPDEPKLTSLPDFRVLNHGDEMLSPEAVGALRDAMRRQETVLELAFGNYRAPDLPELPAHDPEKGGALLRAALGVTIDEQGGVTDAYYPLRVWREAAEDLGIFVMQSTRVGLDEFRGFSLAHPVPVVVLNSNDFPRGRLFTLLHELAHLARHQFGICTPSRVPPNSSLYPPEEVYCNAVAAAALMPSDAVEASVAAVDVGGGGEVSDADLGRLAHRFGVSREAMLRRLVTLGVSTHAFYAEKREEFLRAYGESVPAPGGNHYTNQVARLGRPFCNLVLGAYSEGRLPLSEAAMTLGVRPTKLQEIARRVA